MQKIIVASVETKTSKDGTKKFYVIKDDTGAEFSSFDAHLAKAQTGDTIEAEIEVKGKYINIKDGFKIITAEQPSGVGTPTAQQKSFYGKSPGELAAERHSIERQTSLKAAVEFLRGSGEYTPGVVLRAAEQFYQWITSGKTPDPSKIATESKSDRVSAEAGDNLFPKETTPPEIEPFEQAVPKSAGELFNWMRKHIKDKNVYPKNFALACGVTEEQLSGVPKEQIKSNILKAYQLIKEQNPDWEDYPD